MSGKREWFASEMTRTSFKTFGFVDDYIVNFWLHSYTTIHSKPHADFYFIWYGEDVNDFEKRLCVHNFKTLETKYYLEGIEISEKDLLDKIDNLIAFF